jgi:hypothetical protein
MDIIAKAWDEIRRIDEAKTATNKVDDKHNKAPMQQDKIKEDDQGQEGSVTEVIMNKETLRVDNKSSTDDTLETPNKETDAYRIRTKSGDNSSSATSEYSKLDETKDEVDGKPHVSHPEVKKDTTISTSHSDQPPSTNDDLRTEEMQAGPVKRNPEPAGFRPNHERIAKIMDNTSSVFPAALKLTSTTTHKLTTPTATAEVPPTSTSYTSPHTPFITLHPTFITSISGEDLLFALDEIMAMAFYSDHGENSEAPLFIPSTGETSTLCFMDLIHDFLMRVVASSVPHTKKTEALAATSIPLYMLVLFRFQLSLAESFASRKEAAAKSTGDDEILKPHSKTDSKSVNVIGLVSRISELGDADSSKAKTIANKLEPYHLGYGDKTLFNLLLPSFKHVTGRLCSSHGETVELSALQSIDTAFESALSEVANSDEEMVGLEFPLVDDKDIQVEAKADAETHEEPVPTEEAVAEALTKKSKRRKKKKVSSILCWLADFLCVREADTLFLVQKKKNSGGSNGGSGNSDTSKQLSQHQPEQSQLNNMDQHVEKESQHQQVAIKEIAQASPTEKTKEHVGKTGPLKPTQGKASSRPEDNGDILCSSVGTIKPFPPSLLDESSTKDPSRTHEPNHPSNPPAVTDSDQVVSRQSKASHPEESTSNRANDAAMEASDQSKKVSSSEDVEPSGNEEAEAPVDEDQWETVGARPRDRRKKGSNANAPSTATQQGGNTKKKSKGHKQRKATRRFVKDIMNSVLDSVEQEVQRKRSLSRDKAKRTSHNVSSLTKRSTASTEKQPSSTATKTPAAQKKGSTMRDSVFGENGNAANLTNSEKNLKAQIKASASTVAGSPADQNTVPTIPETLSGAPRDQKARSIDSSSGDSLEAQKSRGRLEIAEKDTSPSPPLPTLLSPGNNNSSSSSVASSLDAPHDSLPDPKENEVGYHLLGVCKRLSNEIDLFMRRREDALAVRRHERGLVLAALQKTLGGIWPGMCSVNRYGSCATNLDLPSSDLDVVVCGLHNPIELVQSPSNATSSIESITGGDNSATEDEKTQEDEAMGRVSSQQEMSQYSSDQQHYSPQQVAMHHNMNVMYPQMSVNAERVVRLAMELEHQPWAVHVKAIPTATVPVIKILADPARLSGAMGASNEWLVQHRVPTHSASDSSGAQNNNQSPVAHFGSPEAPPLWRGADVVNGLLKVDITFEGPEHGGIDSTKFSAQKVEDFAAETGVAPEATPAVQVLMVLKELLAQRRLNEPFSGGLSSYALLLLVISVIKERSIIREELEKAERQRRVVAAGGGNSALRSPGKAKKAKDAKPEDIRLNPFAVAAKESAKNNSPKVVSNKKANVMKGTEDGNLEASSTNPKTLNTQSSWANIARKSSFNGSSPHKRIQEAPQGKDQSCKGANSSEKVLKKPSSFADAVAKGVTTQSARQATPLQQSPPDGREHESAKTIKKNTQDEGIRKMAAVGTPTTMKDSAITGKEKQTKGKRKGSADAISEQIIVQGNGSSEKSNRVKSPSHGELAGLDLSLFPQGFNDVVEVLCSGETTPGKLLMHFLLFYGQHFDSQSTAIDYSGTHQRDANNNQGYSVRSPYMQRRSAGNYDPVTGMLTVDPIVVYDPLEGAESNNVARSCFAWSSIRWLFAQSYMTISSAVEMNAGKSKANANRTTQSEGPAYGHDKTGNVVVDPNSPLLELLLSF